MKERVIIALQGAKLAGGNPANKRVENDFYATNPIAVGKLLAKYDFNGTTMLEPCVGMGILLIPLVQFITTVKILKLLLWTLLTGVIQAPSFKTFSLGKLTRNLK